LSEQTGIINAGLPVGTEEHQTLNMSSNQPILCSSLGDAISLPVCNERNKWFVF